MYFSQREHWLFKWYLNLFSLEDLYTTWKPIKELYVSDRETIRVLL